MAPQGSSPDGFSREVQLFCVALGRVVAVSDLCLPVIPKRRSGQLAPSNNNPERSNDPLSASWELSHHFSTFNLEGNVFQSPKIFRAGSATVPVAYSRRPAG